MEQLRAELSHLLGENSVVSSVSMKKRIRRCGLCMTARETQCRCWQEALVRQGKHDSWHGKPPCWRAAGLSVCQLFMV